VQDSLTLTIEGIADSGEGVARLDGKVYFVAGAAPGDRMDVRVLRDAGRWARALPIGILEPGPGRVDPSCPLAGRCGGCQFQHLCPETEVEAKGRILKDALQRIGGMRDLPEIQVERTAFAGYRRRARFHGLGSPEGLKLGFLAAGSHELVPQESCPLLEPGLRSWIEEFRGRLNGRMRERFELKAEFTLLEGGALQLLLRVSHRAAESLLGILESWETPAPLHLSLRALERSQSFKEAQGAPFLLERLKLAPSGKEALEFSLFTRPGDFIQSNAEGNRAMISRVLEHLDLSDSPWVLDLYAGSGNFTLPLALSGAKTLGVEENRGALRSARRGARESRCARARFKAGRVGEILPTLSSDGRRYRTVLLDPPREGSVELAPWLDPLGIREILSVSCNPSTLARDMKAWTDKGFRLEALHLFNFFPRTRHVESLALLRR